MRKVLHFLCMYLKSRLAGWILVVEIAMPIVNSTFRNCIAFWYSWMIRSQAP